MDTFFLLCAVIGGTVMLLQFALALFGMGHHGGGDFSGGDVGHGDFAGHDASISHDGSSSHDGSHDSAHHGDTIWLFKIITFQTLVAGIAFFGIGGKAALDAEVQPLMALIIAGGVGFGAMNAVYYLVRAMNKFNADGTMQIDRAVGQEGIVYLPVPGSNAGAGKIHVNLQNRFTELQAMTSKDRLPAGTKIKITRVLGSDMVEVEPLIEAEIASHA